MVSVVPLLERSGHARDLLARIDEILRGAGATPADLAGIGVAVGPGSFTGIRVGMATAKGLAYSLGIGLEGISTLEAIARAALRAGGDPGEGICAVMEAGRGELYAALFRVERGEVVRTTPDRSWRPAALVEAIPERFVLAGDGALTAVREAAGSGHGPLRAVEDLPLLAGPIALWASVAIAPDTGYRPGSLGPNYVRPSDAEATRRRP